MAKNETRKEALKNFLCSRLSSWPLGTRLKALPALFCIFIFVLFNLLYFSILLFDVFIQLCEIFSNGISCLHSYHDGYNEQNSNGSNEMGGKPIHFFGHAYIGTESNQMGMK